MNKSYNEPSYATLLKASSTHGSRMDNLSPKYMQRSLDFAVLKEVLLKQKGNKIGNDEDKSRI